MNKKIIVRNESSAHCHVMSLGFLLRNSTIKFLARNIGNRKPNFLWIN